MKTFFLTGLACVVLGLLSLVIRVPHAQQQTFQSESIRLEGARSEGKPVPALVGSILIVGGLALMVSGCRESRR